MEEKREGGALNYEISSSIYRLKLAQRRDAQGFNCGLTRGEAAENSIIMR